MGGYLFLNLCLHLLALVPNRGNLDLVEGEVEQVHRGSLGQDNRGNLDLVKEEVEQAHRGTLRQHNRGNLDLVEEEVEQAHRGSLGHVPTALHVPTA